MAFIIPADDPLPYRPIRIIDVSPHRTDLWEPTRAPGHRGRAAAAAGAILAVVRPSRIAAMRRAVAVRGA